VRPIGLLSVTWSGWNLAYNPQDGYLYSVAQPQSQTTVYLYRIDPQTGVATLIAPITGASWFGTGMAINSAGIAYMGCLSGALCTLDLATGSTSSLGTLAINNGTIADMAFDANDQLWAAYRGGTGPESGLYKIDLATLGATKVGTGKVEFYAITFGPSCAPTNYCTGKMNSLGCLPTIEGIGYPAPSAAFGFKIVSKNVRNNRFGVLIASTNGRAAIPFLGGTLCLATPISRTVISSSGGSPAPVQDCSGVWVGDFNAYLFSLPGPADPIGTQYNVQWWGRDVLGNAALTPGLEFTLCP
jgi:hypothetical protein